VFQLANEFLLSQTHAMVPATFHMDSLLHEMQAMEAANSRFMPRPGELSSVDITASSAMRD
jgi:hypothetical protein